MNKGSQNIAIIGSGYVGMSLAILLSQRHKVNIYDLDEKKLEKIDQKLSPIKDDLIDDYLRTKNLKLYTKNSLNEAVKNANIIIVATPTNYDENKNFFDTDSVDETINQILRVNSEAFIVIKSTLPEGHTEYLKNKFNTENIIFSPEFLREGRALYDNLYPSRIILGSKCHNAQIFANMLKQASLKSDAKVLLTSSREAESIKLFSNTYLALRIAFFNELDSYALSKGLNSEDIINGVSMDERIGNHYNNPSFGYGGYCLPKDTKQLIANFEDIPQDLINSVISSNNKRKKFIADHILMKKPEVIGFYKLAMKKDSDNSRSSSVIDVIDILKESESEIIIYEPNEDEASFNGFEIENNIESFKGRSDLIVANRLDDELIDVKAKVFSRDIFKEN
ncbi:nucleotide sugar dehydrogenase [Gammaproteobacteria bacterium]|nr:nucleotide sugar dehydrogenase [Gammaproteobacteria bacterium]